MKRTSLILLVITSIFLSFTSCKKDGGSGSDAGSSEEALFIGKWGWWKEYDRLFDDAGTEYETEHPVSAPWEHGRGDAYNEYFTGGKYHTVYDTGYDLPGTWSIKNGRFKQDLVEYDEFHFENDNRYLILKTSEYKTGQDGKRYRNDHYSVLSKDYLPE